MFNQPNAAVATAFIFGLAILITSFAGYVLFRKRPARTSDVPDAKPASQGQPDAADTADLIEYTYKPKIGKLVLGVLFFGLGGAFMAGLALANNRGLTIDSLLNLSARQATEFYRAMAAALFAMAFVALVGLLKAMTSETPPILRLTPSELRVPQGFFTRIHLIPLQDVTGLRLRQFGHLRWLEIRHNIGKVDVMENMLPDAAAFNRVCDFVAAKTSRTVSSRTGGPWIRSASQS